jgi:hypothetical protein
LTISILAVVLAANGDMPEWGMPLSACLTTLPLMGVYDRLLDQPSIPMAVQVLVPISIGTVIYAVFGAIVGYSVERVTLH